MQTRKAQLFREETFTHLALEVAQIAAETETDQAPAVERVRQTGVKTIAVEGLEGL